MESIVVALVKTSGDLFGKVIDRWRPSADKADKDVTSLIAKNTFFETLRSGVGDHSVRVLMYLEDGENRATFQIRKVVYPGLKLSGEMLETFDHEFDYRLQYLQAIGLLAKAGSRYVLSRLGRAFLQRARQEHIYQKILFPRKR